MICAGALLAQDRQRGPSDVDDTEEVGLDLGAEVGLGGVLDRGHVRVPGVVHQDVQAPERLDGGVDGPPRRGRVGHVQGDEADAVPVRVHEVREGLGAPGGGDQVVARLKDRLGEGTAQAARASGDQPCLAHDDASVLWVVCCVWKPVVQTRNPPSTARWAPVT